MTTMLTWQADDGHGFEGTRLHFGAGRAFRALGRLVRADPGAEFTASYRLVVRDDGTTRDGVPYLVLDPPAAESVAALRARGRAGTRLPLGYVMTMGDALARVVASIHALGYGLAGLEDEDVLVFANGDVALLDLHALSPATPAGVAADVRALLRVLSALVADVADASMPRNTRASIDGALAASYPDVAALQAAWRAAAPEPIAVPARLRMGSLADVSATLLAAAPSVRPEALASRGGPPEKDPDGSVIGYLRSGMVSTAPPPPVGPRERPLMYDPLSKVPDMPRLVQASLRPPPEGAPSPSRRALLVAAVVVPPALAALVVAVLFVAGSGAEAQRPKPAASLEVPAVTPPTTVTTPTTTTTTPPTAPSTSAAAIASAAAPQTDDELELETQLRTDGAPPDRDVFLDGKKVGKTPLSVAVPCGRHTLQMVAGAPLQAVELPCGGARVVRYDAKGHWSLKAE